jgi:hypothetical protein
MASPTPSHNAATGPTKGLITGIVIASLAFILGCLLLYVCCCKRVRIEKALDKVEYGPSLTRNLLSLDRETSSEQAV